MEDKDVITALVSMVGGNVGGEYIEDLALKTENTMFNPDPATSGRIISLVVGIPLAVIGYLVNTKTKQKTLGIATACAGAGIAANGISDLIIYELPKVSPISFKASPSTKIVGAMPTGSKDGLRPAPSISQKEPKTSTLLV